MTPFSIAAWVLWPALAQTGSPAAAGAASALDALPAGPQCELELLTAADKAESDQFGYAVAVSGERVLVGCPLDDLVGIDSGSAYVFERVGSEWVQSVKLGPPSNALSGDWFGAAVALAGDIAVVGGEFTSAAWVFENVGGVWLETAELLPGDGDADGFGRSVAVSGERVLVGAFADDDLALNAGQVFVFERGPDGWAESASFGPASLDPNDWFGASVALDGDLALVGAPGDDEVGVTAGAAYVFEHVGGLWVERAKLTAANGADGDLFGDEVALSGDVALVGAWAHDGAAGASSGAAYVFRRAGVAWSPDGLLEAPDAIADDRFGSSVSVSGDTALVGAFLQNLPIADCGAAYVFQRHGSGWSLSAKLSAGDAQIGDFFGSSVALAADRAVVGARLADNPQPATGAAYVWSTSGTGCPSLLGVPEEISLSAGGAQVLTLHAGAANALRLYFVLGSVTGTSPGIVVDGWLLPLNIDAYYVFMLLHPNTLVQGSLGVLDTQGAAKAVLALPPGMDPGLAGVVLTHAYVVLDLAGPAPIVAFASQAAGVGLVQ